MNIFRILQADVFTKSNLGTESQRASMIEYAQQIKQDSEQKQLNFSNKGCWRHEFDYPDISWLVEELRQLTNSAIETYANSDPLYNEKLKSYGPPVINYWTMNLTESCHPHAPYTSRYALSPEDGQLILWPAWMPHETEVNKSNMQRINVAFNIRFQTPRYIGEN